MPPVDSIPPERLAALQDTVRLIEKRSGTIIPVGSNPSVTPILLTLDKVNVSMWRPFAWYATIKVVNVLLRKWYESVGGMHYGTYHGQEYLLQIPKSWNRNTGPRPVVFWHGLGLGMLQYKMTITNLTTLFPDRPLLIPIQPQISQDIFHPRFLTPMGRRETVAGFTSLLVELGWVTRSQIDGSDSGTDADEGSPAVSKGVTMMSHSK